MNKKNTDVVTMLPTGSPQMRLLRHPWDGRPIAEVPVESYEVLTALLDSLWARRRMTTKQKIGLMLLNVSSGLTQGRRLTRRKQRRLKQCLLFCYRELLHRRRES